MIKIKDNVDLKELDKFGFKLYIARNGAEFYFDNHGLEIKGDVVSRNGLCKREITCPHNLGHDKLMFNTLYNLIKADLVEEVKE